MTLQGGKSILEYAQQDTDINWRALKLRVLISIQKYPEQSFELILFIRLDFIGGYSFLYFYFACISKQSRWEHG